MHFYEILRFLKKENNNMDFIIKGIIKLKYSYINYMNNLKKKFSVHAFILFFLAFYNLYVNCIIYFTLF